MIREKITKTVDLVEDGTFHFYRYGAIHTRYDYYSQDFDYKSDAMQALKRDRLKWKKIRARSFARLHDGDRVVGFLMEDGEGKKYYRPSAEKWSDIEIPHTITIPLSEVSPFILTDWRKSR